MAPGASTGQDHGELTKVSPWSGLAGLSVSTLSESGGGERVGATV